MLPASRSVAPGTRLLVGRRASGPAARRADGPARAARRARGRRGRRGRPGVRARRRQARRPRLFIRSRRRGTPATAAASHELVAPDLMAEWERRLDDFDRKGWRNHVRADRRAHGRVRRARPTAATTSSDRVVVRIEAKLRDYVVDRDGQPHQARRAAQRDRSACASSGRSGRRDGPLDPGLDRAGRRGRARARRRRSSPRRGRTSRRCATRRWSRARSPTRVPTDVKLAEVADLEFEGDARAAALDLSLADGRFAPDVLEVAARRAVAAWAEAVDGDDARAERDRRPPRRPTSCCTPATRARARGWSSAGHEVKQIRIVGLDAARRARRR